MSGLQNRLNESCRRCVLAPGTQLAPGAERGDVNVRFLFLEIKDGPASALNLKKGGKAFKNSKWIKQLSILKTSPKINILIIKW